MGEGGNWSDAAHWSLSSGGASGECSPSLVDNVIVDANSFTTTGQTLTIDLASSNCRSIDCRAATNGMTLRSVASNLLGVYGSVSWAPAPNMTVALAGGCRYWARELPAPLPAPGNGWRVPLPSTYPAAA